MAAVAAGITVVVQPWDEDKMRAKKQKEGQAMVEFMVGLIGILVLILALSYIGRFVAIDCKNFLEVRSTVAENMLNSRSSSARSSYDPAGSYLYLSQSINKENGYSGLRSLYPQQVRTDRFRFLSDGDDPLHVMIGSGKGKKVPITSPLMQKVLGRSEIFPYQEFWMPMWDDLL